MSSKYLVEQEDAGFKISKNENYIENFFGSNVSNLSILIGKNGSGKTTFLKSIINLLSDSQLDDDGSNFNYFIVYEYKSILYYFSFKDLVININGLKVKKSNTQSAKSHINDLSNIFHSQHIDSLYSTNIYDKTSKIIKNKFDISTAHSFRNVYTKLLKRRSNKKLEQLSSEFKKKEYTLFLKAFKDEIFTNNFNNPKYISINVDKSIYSLNEVLNKYDSLSQKINNDKKDDFIENIFQSFLGSLINNITVEKDLTTLLDKIDRIKSASRIEKLNRINKYLNEELKYELEVINKIVKLLSDPIVSDISNYGIYFNIKSTRIDSIMKRIAETGIFNTEIDYLEVTFCHDFLNEITYSSGEYTTIGLFSRLYDLKLKKKLNKYNILCLDESEISFHPSLQREFLKKLLDFLNSNFPKNKFQVVIGTHSPLLLSDVPRYAVNVIENSSENYQHETLETFGANIHELYASGFGLGKNLIGEFAESKIKSIVDKLNESNHLTDEDADILYKKIVIIGNTFIRNTLLSQLNKKNNNKVIDKLIELKQKELDDLKNQRNDKN